MILKIFSKFLFVFSISAFAQAETSQFNVNDLADDPYGQLVKYGKSLTDQTYAIIGPQVNDSAMRYSGNNLACSNCHQESATKKFSLPWTGVYASFPQYRAREDSVSMLSDRINGCMERSMNGKPLPLDSKEMKAFLTYMHFLSRGVMVGSNGPEQGLPKYTPPDRQANLAEGEKIYLDKCVACHGKDGTGLRKGTIGDTKGYQFPPLWGNDSFNNGAGMYRLLTAFAFIQSNMPLGASYEKPVLTRDEAYDVAGYVLSQPRAQKSGLDRDFPARWNKPVDAAFPPYVDGYPAQQHKYGPFAPLIENMKNLKATSTTDNAPSK